MNRFSPVSGFLRMRLESTSYENVEQFRQLLLLERLILQPLRAWPAEAMFVGLRETFAIETKLMNGEFRSWDRHSIPLPRARPELDRLIDRRRPENRERIRRERAAWIAAGGLP